MAQQTINIGTTVNDGTGDDGRTGADKINDNFAEIYGAGNTVLNGTWTPTVTGATTPGSATYSSRGGGYLRIGPWVLATFDIRLSVKTGIVGNIRIGGLPFAVGAAAPQVSETGMLSYWTLINLDTSITGIGAVLTTAGVSYCELRGVGDNVPQQVIDDADLSATSIFRGFVAYSVD